MFNATFNNISVILWQPNVNECCINLYFLLAEKKLFTPGPLSTSLTVRQAALTEYGSRDVAFIAAIKTLRSKLIQIAGRLFCQQSKH